MLVHKNKHKKLMQELHVRYNELILALEGTQATESDKYHGLKNTSRHWPIETLNNTYKIDDTQLRLTLADFKTILIEIGRLK